jgi:TonB-linked SusC/RagA family outer membrane protein
MSVKQVSSDIFGMSGFDEGIPNTMGSALSSSALFSYLGRVNYNYKSKYYITASFRADASSKFSPENRWGYFPSGSLAWTITQEKFMKQIPSISNAKVRASWGMTGNNRVGDFDYLAKLQKLNGTEYSFDNIAASPSMKMTTLGNPGLKWETTDQTNVGMDLGLFKQRVTFTVDAYKKVTRDLLLNADLPGSAGFLKIYKNIGRIQNQGLEFTLGADIIKSKKFLWNTSFNISFNQSKVLALTDNQEAMLQAVGFYNTPPYIAKVGQSLGQIYGYIYEGTYKYDDFDKTGSSYSLKTSVPGNGIGRNLIQPGDPKFRDINGDGQINDLDRTVIGNATPIHTGGWNNNFVWGNFDLNLFFQWSYGNDIVNANRIVMEGTTNFDTNQFASFANRWTPANPTSNIPRAARQTPTVYSSRIVEDGSYIRLKTIQIGYNVPGKLTKKIKLNNLRFYAATQNIFTLTNYSGSDPEVSVRNSALTPGYDYSAYPRAFTFTIGLNTKF